MPQVIRDPGPRRRFWLAAGLVLLAGWGAWSLVAHVRRRGLPAPMPAEPGDPAFDRVYLRDVEQASWEGGEKRWSLSAAEIVHRKRKMGPLTVNPVKEIEMTGVRIEVHHDDPLAALRARDAGLDLPIGSILEATLAAKDLGFVSRVLIRRLDLTVLRDGEPFFGIVTGGAAIGLDPGRVRFSDGVTVTGRAGERLEANAAEWRSDSRRLIVPGAFRVEDANGSRQGSGAAFRIDADGRLAGD